MHIIVPGIHQYIKYILFLKVNHFLIVNIPGKYNNVSA